MSLFNRSSGEGLLGGLSVFCNDQPQCNEYACTRVCIGGYLCRVSPSQEMVGSKVNACQILIDITNLPSKGLRDFALSPAMKGRANFFTMLVPKCIFKVGRSQMWSLRKVSHCRRRWTRSRVLTGYLSLCVFVHVYVFLFPVLAWFLSLCLLTLRNQERWLSQLNLIFKWKIFFLISFSFAFWHCLWHILLILLWIFFVSMDWSLSVLIIFII